MYGTLFDVAEVLKLGQQAVIGDIELLHFCPLAFVNGAVAFDGEHPTPMVFFHPLQVVHIALTAFASHLCP